MKSAIINITRVLVVLLLLMPAMISCGSMHNHVREIQKLHLGIPYKSFAAIYVDRKIIATGCPKQEKMGECLKILKQLPIVPNNGFGSGILIYHKGKKFVLTAAHVCTVPGMEFAEYNGFKFSLKMEESIEIQFYGKNRRAAKIVAIDDQNDLCLLAAPENAKKIKPVYLASEPPRIGEKIYNISAPLAINGPNMALMFDGYFSGVMGRFYYYTVPAKPGASGSAILNRDYQIVGTVNIAATKFENLAIGTGWHQLKIFLDKID